MPSVRHTLLTFVVPFTTACGGNDDSSPSANANSASSSEEREYWSAAEGEWTTTERAISTDCEASASDLSYFAANNPQCVSLSLEDYQGQLLLVGRDCESGIDRLHAGFELNDEGRMLTSTLEYFQPGSSDYPCTWDRAQYEFIFENEEPYIVFFNWSVDLEGVVDCPDKLPDDVELACVKFVYRVE